MLRLLLCWQLFSLATHAQAPSAPTLELDAIALTAGREVRGKPEHSWQHGRFTYWFESAEHLALFAADPERRGIQWNGACGRMGPLSGAGRLDLAAAHDGSIYLFASPGCRTRFLADAKLFVERDEPAPEADPARAERAAELVRRARTALGLDSVAAPIALHRSRSERIESGGTEYQVQKHNWLELESTGARLCREESWNERGWGTWVCSTGGGQRAVLGSEREPSTGLVPAQQRAFVREELRDPLLLLHFASLPGAQLAHAGLRDFAAHDVGQGAAEGVSIWWQGATTTLWLDAESGMPLATSFVARGPNATFGAREDWFSSWSELPFEEASPRRIRALARSEARFEGARAASLDRDWQVLELLPALEAELFR